MANELYQRPGQTADPATGLVAKVYSARVVDALYDKPGLWKRFMNFTAEVSSRGESVVIPVMPYLTAVDVNFQTGAVAFNDTTHTSQELLMSQWKAVPYRLPKNVKLSAKIDLEGELAKNAANAVSDSIDAEITELMSGFTTHIVGDGTDPISEDLLYGAMEALMGSHVDPSINPMDFVWVIHTSCFTALKKLGIVSSAYVKGKDAVGGADMYLAQDTLFGIPLFFRGDSAMASSGNIVRSGLFHKSAIAVGIQSNMELTVQPASGTLATEYITDCIFGVKELRDEYGCIILTDKTV